MALWLESSYVSGNVRNKKENSYKIIVNNLCAGGTEHGPELIFISSQKYNFLLLFEKIGPPPCLAINLV